MADVMSNNLYLLTNDFPFQFFVVGVALLTTAVVSIAYWIGFPFWWEKSPAATILLLIVGNWLLLNVIFHYVMAVITPAGEPPEVSVMTSIYFVLYLYSLNFHIARTVNIINTNPHYHNLGLEVTWR